MKYVLLALSVAILTSCGGNLKQFQVPENAAMSAAELPLFAGITDIMSGNSFKTLKPGTQVYLTADSATGNGVKYVKIVFGDSSAYTYAHRLMPRGSWAVVTAAEGANSVYVYSSIELETIRQSIDNDWALVVAGEPAGDVTQVMYDREGDEPLIGYMPTVVVYNDQGSVAYYKEYLDAQDSYQAGSEQPLKDLFANANYSGLRVAQWRSAIAEDLFGGDDMDERGDAESGEDYDSPYAEGDGEYGDYYDERETIVQERDWTMDGAPLTDSEVPGKIKKYFVFEDGTEMSAEGYTLANATPWKLEDQSNTKTVKKVRIEFTPARQIDLVRIDVDTFYEAGSQYNTGWAETFQNVSPNKPCSITVEDKPGSMIFCSVIRAIVTVGDITATATVSGDCGD